MSNNIWIYPIDNQCVKPDVFESSYFRFFVLSNVLCHFAIWMELCFFRNHLSVLTDLKMQINIEYRNESIHLSNPAPLIRIEWLLNQSID